MDPRFFLIAAAAAGLWYGGQAVVHGTQKTAHRVARAFKHGKDPKAAGESPKAPADSNNQ